MDEILLKAQMFAGGKIGARQNLTGDDLATAKMLWWPTVAGKCVDAGFHEKREDALDAARGFREKCRDYVANNPGKET